MRIIQLPPGRRHMRGSGIGALFSKLTTLVKPLLKTAFRAAKPIATRTLKQLGKEGLNAIGGTASDVLLNNMSIQDAAKKNARSGLRRARKVAKTGAKRAFVSGVSEVRKDIKRRKQTGSGRKKRQRRRTTVKRKKRRQTSVKKKKRVKRRKRKNKPYRGIFQ